MATEKKTEQATPKWGTKEWIAAYPWSKMDRKRKRRVIAALPEHRGNLLAQDVGKVPYLHACVSDALPVSAKDAERARKALALADASAVKVMDVVVAAWLTEVWGLKADAPKGKKTK